ncbi:hypothetical protein HDV03_000814 [Kappamyces sp. JEL0829]|nr:hypothetical protein HDV03_000814 [Kappamyces sp. JEL0829]
MPGTTEKELENNRNDTSVRKGTSSIQAFRNIVSSLSKLADLQDSYPAGEMDQVAISLYDHWLNNSEKMPELSVFEEHMTADLDMEAKLKYLFSTLKVLDPSETITPRIINYNVETDEELDDFLPRSRLSSPDAAIYRVVVLCSLALGKAFNEAGNSKLGVHILRLAGTIQERVIRTTNKQASDELISKRLYSSILSTALHVGEFDLAIETGTKIAARYEASLADYLTFDDPSVSFDVPDYYHTLTLLAEAGEKSSQPKTTVYACTKMLELFSVERRLLKDPQASILDLISVPSSIKDCQDCRELLQQNLCLQLVQSNEMAHGDAFVSLSYARSALEHFALIRSADQNKDIQEHSLQFMLGRLLYQAALSLAGGVELASSPPIAVLAPAANSPTIKGLLEEALDVLEDARRLSPPGKTGPDCQEAVEVQIAFVALELRIENRARAALVDLDMNNAALSKWDASRRDGTNADAYFYLSAVVYSPEVFRRLLLTVAPSPRSLGSKLTLSRKRTENSDVPTKAQCSYCSMQCVSAIKCAACAEGRRMVYYCTEDCRLDHEEQHAPTCLANNGTLLAILLIKVMFRNSPESVAFLVSEAIFIDMLIYGILIPVLPDKAIKLGIPENWIGSLLSCYSLGAFLTPLITYVSDRNHENKKIPFIFASVVSIASSFLWLIDSPIAFVAARMLQGIASGTTWSIGFSMLPEAFPRNLGKVFGLVLAFNTIGNLVGPPLGGYFKEEFNGAPFYICLLFALIDLLLRLFLRAPVCGMEYQAVGCSIEETEALLGETEESQASADAPALGEQTQSTFWRYLTEMQMVGILVTIFVCSAVFSSIEPTLPILLEVQWNLSSMEVGVLWAVISIPKLLASSLSGILSDRYERRMIILLGLLVFAAASAAIVVSKSAGLVVFSVELALFGAGTGLALTPCLAELNHIADSLDIKGSGTLYAVYNFVSALGMMVGPTGGSFLFATGGLEWQMLVATIALVLVSLVTAQHGVKPRI